MNAAALLMTCSVILICIASINAISSSQTTCQDIIKPGKPHIDILADWRKVSATLPEEPSNIDQNGDCLQLPPCQGDSFLSLEKVDRGVDTDYSWAGPVASSANLTGTGTLQFHDSPTVCVRGICRQGRLYADQSQQRYLRADQRQRRYLRAPVIAATGSFCRGALQGRAAVIFATGSLVLADFCAGVVEGFAREFRGGELVGVANYSRGVLWRMEAREETNVDYWKEALRKTKTIPDYFITDGDTAVFVTVEQGRVRVFAGHDHGGVVSKVRRSDIVGWECRGDVPFPITRVRKGFAELDVFIDGVVEDADLLLYQVTKLRIQLDQARQLRARKRNTYRRFLKNGTFPLTGLVSFPGSGNSWVRLLVVHTTAYRTADEIGSLDYVPDISVTTRSHHFPQQPKFHVGPIFREHQTFYDDVIGVCQRKSSYIADMATCATIIQPDKVHWIGDDALEKLGVFELAPHEEKHPPTYLGAAGQLAKDRVAHVARFNGRAVFIVRNPVAAVLSWWWHFLYGAHSGSDKFAKDAQFQVHLLYTDVFHRFVEHHIEQWKRVVQDWVMLSHPLVVHYENIKRNPSKQLKNILLYLDVKPNSSKMREVALYGMGINVKLDIRFEATQERLTFDVYRRKKVDIKKDPFTKHLREKADEAVEEVNALLQRFGHEPLPVDQYLKWSCL